eukprot:1904714-Amphidinium_carterae.1
MAETTTEGKTILGGGLALGRYCAVLSLLPWMLICRDISHQLARTAQLMECKTCAYASGGCRKYVSYYTSDNYAGHPYYSESTQGDHVCNYAYYRSGTLQDYRRKMDFQSAMRPTMTTTAPGTAQDEGASKDRTAMHHETKCAYFS